MSARDDMKIDSPLFRAVITTTRDADPAAPPWSGRREAGSTTSVYGPYVTPAPAKRWITVHENRAKGDPHTAVAGVVETAQPAWTRLPG